MASPSAGASSAAQIYLRVKTLDSNTHHVSVVDSDTVTELKRKVCDQTGVDVDRQRLIFQGKVLKDDKNVNFYAIRDGMTIHMVERVHTPVPRSRPAQEAPPAARQRGAFMFRGEGVSVVPPSARARPVPSSLQISETPEGLVVGASIDLNDDRGHLPPMENLLSSVFGLIRRGGSPRQARRPRGTPPTRSNGGNGGNAGVPQAVHSFSVAGLPFTRISSIVGPAPPPAGSSREQRSAHGFSRRRAVIDPAGGAGSGPGRRDASRGAAREDMNASTVRLRQHIRDTTAQLDMFVNEQESSMAASNSASSSGSSSTSDGNNMDQLADSLIGVGDAIREMLPVLQRMGFILKNQEMYAQRGSAAERAERERQLLQRLRDPCRALSGALHTMSDLTRGLSQNLRVIDPRASARRTAPRRGNTTTGRPVRQRSSQKREGRRSSQHDLSYDEAAHRRVSHGADVATFARTRDITLAAKEKPG